MGRAANRSATCSGLMVCAGILTVLLSPATSVAATCEPSIAKAMAVEGKVDVRHPDGTQWQPVKLHDTFCPGDVIRVQERSRADIALSNQPMLRLDQNTTMTLGGIKKEGGSLIELVKGATHFFSRVPRNLEVRTAFVNAGVEGTEGVIRVTDDKAEVTIFEGKVVAANESGTLNITDGQSVVAEKGKAPSYHTVVKPRDAVQWALYYPPVMDLSPDAAVKEDDPRSLAGRAARSLSVGRVDEANIDIDRALKLDPKNSDALSLQSIIAVVQNDKDKALTLAQQAVAADPNSASAKTALSYAQQARFDLDGARKTLEQEVQAHPDNALAWARLAELRASFSELDGALDAAQKAVALKPSLSRTQTVLGFAYLLQVKTTEAKAAFTKAIEFDQADAMPRLGLGLAKFREGSVEEGRREMEVAASLDPNNAMIRSYLGKAYFEEKRSDMTEREYKNAKELDPKDPTPFFYDALQKQLTNRPVEALKDMEQAIELNKNRAVYRSQLQMDSDVAARSASLGRIYTDLRFQYLGLVEGWRSVNIDPSDFTAHRFLADTYSTLQRHEIARVSELMVSQLLQPLSITPIQPSLAVSNQFLLASLGPGASSFNEFNTLMVNRDRNTALSSVLVGERGTFGAEMVAAGIHSKVSYSVGLSNFETNGYRGNTDQRDQLGNLFLQFSPSPDTSIQVEYRLRHLRTGDTQLKFFESAYEPNLRVHEDRNIYRLGVRHNLAPNSTLLGSFIYANGTSSQTDPGLALLGANGTCPTCVGFNSIRIKTPEDALTGELQHQFRSTYVNLITGGSIAHINRRQDLTLGLDSAFFGICPACAIPPNNIYPNATIPQNLTHGTLYEYALLRPHPTVLVTLGGSLDLRSGEARESTGKAMLNPKAGIMWEPINGTLIRLAAFRVMKRTLINNQTLESTQVGGFNQFFDDINGSTGWRYGAAVNQKLTQGLYVGGEATLRDLSVPFVDSTDPSNPVVTRSGWQEYLIRGYAFWTPHDWIALRTEYLYERTLRAPNLTAGVQSLETQRVPIGATFFHPSGFQASVTGTIVWQEGRFTGIPGLELGRAPQDGSSSFVTLDAGIGYRLPDRYGLLTIGATNITNRKFSYFDTDFNNNFMLPVRMVFAKLTLALP